MSDWARYHGLRRNGAKPKAGYREDLPRYYFRSSWEANYARYLQWLITQGEVAKWEYESETFWFNAIKRGVRSYKPDFKIWFVHGYIQYHEIKGWDYTKGRVARDRMAKYYPNIELVLIDEEWFNGINKSGAWQLIPGWERPERKRDDESDAAT